MFYTSFRGFDGVRHGLGVVLALLRGFGGVLLGFGVVLLGLGVVEAIYGGAALG